SLCRLNLASLTKTARGANTKQQEQCCECCRAKHGRLCKLERSRLYFFVYWAAKCITALWLQTPITQPRAAVPHEKFNRRQRRPSCRGIFPSGGGWDDGDTTGCWRAGRFPGWESGTRRAGEPPEPPANLFHEQCRGACERRCRWRCERPRRRVERKNAL